MLIQQVCLHQQGGRETAEMKIKEGEGLGGVPSQTGGVPAVILVMYNICALQTQGAIAVVMLKAGGGGGGGCGAVGWGCEA